MDETMKFQEREMKAQREEEDEEEALSLCDFPLNSDEPEKKDSSKTQHHRISSPQPSDFFEFYNDVNFQNMSHAEDIISCGKLVPYKQPPLFDDRILKSVSADEDPINLSRRYCESLPELNPTRSNSSASARLTRSSRSLDCKKVRRNSCLVMKSEATDIHRSSSKGSAKSEGFRGSRPTWCPLMFGLVKFPQEMNLQDMKSRRVRRNPGSMFPAAEAGGTVPSNRSSWGHDLLRVLGCKSHASVAVTSSMGLVPQV